MAGFKKGKSLKRARFEEADNASGSDDGAGRAAKPVKKAKTTAATSGKDDEGNSFWAISNTRRVSISNFKGKPMVNIREYYSDNSGELKPGRKGISLPLNQYASLLQAIPQLNAELIELGHELPQVETALLAQEKVASPDNDEEDAPVVKKKLAKKPQKSNFEATSDEEEEDDAD